MTADRIIRAIEYTPRNYQKILTDHLLHNPAVLECGGAALFVGMGLGKTVATLTALVELIEQGLRGKILVIAPKLVAMHTWPSEVKKWKHTRHLKVCVVAGLNEKQRLRALESRANIYVINIDLCAWLVGVYGGKKWPFKVVVADELSGFKNHDSGRFEAMKTVRPEIDRFWGLTGTPAPNSLMDLWAPLYLLDRGVRLGMKITHYRKKYFNQKQDYSAGATRTFNSYQLKEGSGRWETPDMYKQMIYDQISDICISMKAEDWLELPEVIYHDEYVDMSPKLEKQYQVFKRDAVLEYLEQTVTAGSQAALVNKLLQFANGACYTTKDRSEFLELHKLKIEALGEILDSVEGSPILLLYSYQSDVARIMKYLKRYNPYLLRKGMEGVEDIHKWNEGKIKLLIAHPRRVGHGLNMQDGGHHVCWYGLSWSLELYEQANARLPRPGQRNTVIIKRIITRGTMDERVSSVLGEKGEGQNQLMAAVKANIINELVSEIKGPSFSRQKSLETSSNLFSRWDFG